MSGKSWHLSRRTMLRGAGAAVALPLLESMAIASSRNGKPPVRLAWVNVPHGFPMNMPKPDLKELSYLWTPRETGAAYTMSRILEPLGAHRKDFLILTGLAHRRERIPDDTNRHDQEVAIFLTGHPPRRTESPDVQGESIDQMAARKIGHLTPLPSLELGTSEAKKGLNNRGYSGAYENYISWRSATMPTGKEINPLYVFDRMFRGRTPRTPDWKKGRQGSGEVGKLDEGRRSVLDVVLEDARSLKGKLGTQDQRKLDEYLGGIREIERRIKLAAKYGDGSGNPVTELPELQYSDKNEHSKRFPPAYKGVPADYDEHVKLMIDLMVLAFQTDTTRLVTFMLSHPGAPEARLYSRRHVTIKGGWHDHAHKAFEPNGHPSMEAMVKVSRYHSQVVAYLLERMKAVREEGESLLDHSLVMYGGGLGNGGTHYLYNLPILLAGRGGGVKPGRHVDYDWKKRTPLSNLFVEMVNRAGIPTEKFGPSDGGLSDLG